VIAAVPEPGTVWLVAIGLIGMSARRGIGRSVARH
jgi:hypothetical protein